MTSLAVLLVEDDASTARMIGTILAPWHDTLEVYVHANDAMSARTSVDVAIVDLSMQQGAGLALVHFLRARDGALPIVAIAPAADAETETVARSLGVTALLNRPLTGDALLMALSPVRERKAIRAKSLPPRNPVPLQRVLTATDMQTVASALAHTAVDLTGGAVRVVLDDSRGEIVSNLGIGEPSEAIVLSGFDEPVGTLFIDPDADGLLRPGNRQDLLAVTVVAAALAVLWRRLDMVARVGMKDPETSAYTFAYFVDVAGREIERAQRHGRKFALLTIVIDHYVLLASATPSDLLREARRELVDTILDSVRDSDVLANVEDDELYLLVPETGTLGALAYRRRVAERAAKRAELARLESRPAFDVTVGVASYPHDGRDLTSLLKSAHRRANAARAGVARDVLAESRGNLEALLGALLRFRPPPDGWQLRQTALPEDAIAEMGAAVAREAARGGDPREGIVYVLGDRAHPLVSSVVDAMRGSASAVPAYWLRPATSGTRGEQIPRGPNARPVEIEIDGARVGPFALLVALTEGWAYVCVASAFGEYKRVMHACELELAEALVAELQSTFHLQRGLE